MFLRYVLNRASGGTVSVPFAVALLCLQIAGCTPASVERDADVLVVGAGIAGLAAALEAADEGARVLVLEVNSVGGGHAVKAGGFALVDTALQRARGIEDSPGLALNDWIIRGDDPDLRWASRYAENSGTEVYDWLTGLGVEFAMVLPTPEDSVPRFHFTRGTAVNAVLPMMRKALLDPDIGFVWNARAIALARSGDRITSVYVRDERTGKRRLYRAGAVVLATGGFQNDLDQVRANWPAERPQPRRLLAGAGTFATGAGYRLADWAGARMRDLERQVIFYNGIPDPRDPAGRRALHASNPAAIWVDATGRRFIDESSDDKTVQTVVGATESQGYWMIFDARGARRFGVRDAAWLTNETVRREVLQNPEIAVEAEDIGELARRAGLSVHGLRTTVETWNRMHEAGEDFVFGRFDKNRKARGLGQIRVPPFYAVRTYAMTRKNLGGPAIDRRARVVDETRAPIPGLYAAGELTGVAGINGRIGGAGTFLGPSVYTGRIAGRAAARDALPADTDTRLRYRTAAQPDPGAPPPEPGQPGYWHYDAVHALVSERDTGCAECHTGTNAMRAAVEPSTMLARLGTCKNCH